MTMLSFRVPEAHAAEAQRLADALGVDRSELLRDALHRHIAALRAEDDAIRWRQLPASDDELALESVADWDPAEGWADWGDAAR